MSCKKCNKQVCDSERINCRGYCGAVFHLLCVNIDLPVLDILGEHDRNIFWMCNTCGDFFSNDQFKKISLCNDRERAVVPDVIQSMKDDIQKLSGAISTLSAKVDILPQPSQPANPSPWSKKNFLLPNTPKRRRGETTEPVN